MQNYDPPFITEIDNWTLPDVFPHYYQERFWSAVSYHEGFC